MSIFKSTTLIFATTLLFGCSNELIRRTEALPEPDRAYITGKFETSCKPYDEKICMPPFLFSILYRSTHESEVNGILNFNFGDHQYIDNARRKRGRYFCIPLPAGDYQFYNVRFTGGGAYQPSYELKKENHFVLPFNARKGEITYLGTLKLSTETGKNWLGMNLPLPGMLLLSSGSQADIARALQECPEVIRKRELKMALLNPAEAHSAIVQADLNP